MRPQFLRSALTADLRAFADPDRHAGPDGFYTVRSLYLDSPEWTCVHEKLAGESRRHKLRVRAYPASGPAAPIVKFEVKHRQDTRIAKDTVSVAAATYQALLPDLRTHRTPPAALLHRAPRLAGFFRLKQLHAMTAAVTVEFRRQALVVRTDRHVRVTFDDRLMASGPTDPLQPLPAGRPLLGPLHSVLEIKLTHTMPYWLNRLVDKYRLQVESVSKYVRGATAGPFGLDGLS